MHAIVRASVSGCHSLGHLDVASANQFRRRRHGLFMLVVDGRNAAPGQACRS